MTLYAGPLADRPSSGVVRIFFHSAGGAAVYPPGPPAVLSSAPRLFAHVRLADAPPEGPPFISVLPPAPLVPGEDFRLSAQIGNDATIVSVVCSYREGSGLGPAAAGGEDARPGAKGVQVRGESAPAGWAELPMAVAGAGLYSATIPGRDVTGNGLVCRVRAQDVAGRLLDSEEVVGPAAPEAVSEPGTRLAPGAMLAYPNPFRGTTAIVYRVPARQAVSVEVFDVKGGLVRRFALGRPAEAGVQLVNWDGTESSGRALPSGIYFVRVEGETFEAERTITILR